MQRDVEFFGDVDLELVYIAKKLKEALKLEEQLTAAGFDYLVEADTYRGGLIFQTERVGAFFYVAPTQVEQVRAFLVQNRYRPYEPGS
jgi:prenyltransferase beta subunit